jgi:predicted DNA-binding transcriptional regulator AlpA
MPTSNNICHLTDFERLAREAAAVVRREFNAKEFAKLGRPRAWFDLQGAAAHLTVSEPTLSRYIKERTAPRSVKVGNSRRSSRNDLDVWISAGGTFAFKKAEAPMPIERRIILLVGTARVPELDSGTSFDFDVARNPDPQEHRRRSPSLCSRQVGDRSRTE